MARILIVEDEPLIAMMLTDWVEELGHEPVGPACTVEQSLRTIESVKIDAAILDLHLNGERCDRVAEAFAVRTIPMAFATGANADDMILRYAGSLSLAKPYDFESVQRVVEQMCASLASATQPSARGTSV